MPKSTPQHWTEITVASRPPLCDVVAESLVRDHSKCAGGVETRDDGTVSFWVETSHFDDAILEVRQILETLAKLGFDVDPQAWSSRESIQEKEWREAWKEFFKPTELTRQITVVPSWESYASREDEIVIDLDPGMAFGTGAHASTQLVLNMMQELADQGITLKNLLDVGTGSGILAIAGCRLWPSLSCVATDIDPDALDAAKENAAKNGCGAAISVRGDELDLLSSFDLVLANIQAPILIELAPKLAARLTLGGGMLAVSGILTPELDQVIRAYEALGLNLLQRKRSYIDPEWSAALLTLPKNY